MDGAEQERRAPRRSRERGAASLEYVGVVIAALVLLGGVATGLGARGQGLGAHASARIGALVSGDGRAWRWRDARERRTGGGSTPVRISRDELRMDPLLPPVAAWARDWRRSTSIVGTAIEVTARACALCIDAEWSRALGPGVRREGDERFVGVGGELEVAGRMALLSAQATASLERAWGSNARMYAQGRVRGTVGAEADASATLEVGRAGVTVDAEAGAMAGAVAKAEAKAGVELLGIAIRQGGRIEGWAGAGARGAAGVDYGDGRFGWRFGWGAALGLGGAGEWSGEVDVRGVSERHRRLARDALLAPLRLGLIPHFAFTRP